MKNVIYVLGLLVLGFVVYNVISKDGSETANDDIIIKPESNSYLQTQPQQMFPMMSVETPRVDNADQPWYAGSRDFLGMVTDADLSGAMAVGGGFMSYSVNKSWSDLSKMYN